MENERKRLEAIEMRKQAALASLLPEPADDADLKSQITRIRFRLPDGNTLQRKFHISEKLNSIICFVSSQGFFVEEYKILSSWPRRDLTGFLGDQSTIEELKLYPQETLTIEQR